MGAVAGRHPSDAERAQAARPVLEELVTAAGAADADGVAACLDDEVAWLDASGGTRGRDAAAERLLARRGRRCAGRRPANTARTPCWAGAPQTGRGAGSTSRSAEGASSWSPRPSATPAGR